MIYIQFTLLHKIAQAPGEETDWVVMLFKLVALQAKCLRNKIKGSAMYPMVKEGMKVLYENCLII